MQGTKIETEELVFIPLSFCNFFFILVAHPLQHVITFFFFMNLGGHSLVKWGGHSRKPPKQHVLTFKMQVCKKEDINFVILIVK